MSEELVEAVARLYEEKWGLKDHWLARAVVALIRPAVLEEAAGELDGWGDMYGDAAARAIRALKDKA